MKIFLPSALFLPAVLALTAAGHAGTSFPEAPPGATLATASFTSPALVPIPAFGPAVSTIPVSGLAGSVWDVNVVTNIAHSDPADLLVTLVAPSGREVLLSSRNTRDPLDLSFDDAAAVPVSDQLEPLAREVQPERAFATLAGEEPNGEWTLRCDDLVAGDGGAYTWRLEIATIEVAPARTTLSFVHDTPVALPEDDMTTSSLLVESAGFVCDVDVVVHVLHPEPSSLLVTLWSPDQRIVRLAYGQGENSDFYANATFDDAAADLVRFVDDATPAGAVSPVGSLGRFTGLEAAGTWSLVIEDFSGFAGTLFGWELRLTTCAAPGPVAFCTGAAPAPCPCGNNGAADSGCRNATHAGGARLFASGPGGAPEVGDEVVLHADALDPFQIVLFLQGTLSPNGGVGTTLGDGLLCAGGQVRRLATRYSGLGSTSYPGFLDAPLWQRGGIPRTTGGTRVYQALYRSPLLFGPCHTGLNSTNGVRITWLPEEQ